MPPSSALINKLKVQLKLSISRLRMVQQKDTALAKQQRRDMAALLDAGKIESAKIRVENIIRSDLNTELLEILELYCELLIARVGLLEAKECDPGLKEAVQSIIYAAPKIEGVKELTLSRQLLAEKFGKEFTLRASDLEDEDNEVPPRVKDRLRVEPPKKELVEAYLSAIADAYDVDYPPGIKAQREAEQQTANVESIADDASDDEDNQSGGQKVPALEAPIQNVNELSRATPPRNLGPRSPVSVMPPSPSTDNVRPKINLPGAPDQTPSKKSVEPAKKSEGGPGGKIPDVDELARRFASLKR